jgi:hypothetical protein
MEHHCPRRPAFGQIAPIGTLYDARNECFLSGSIFNRGLVVEQTPIKKTTCNVIDNDSYEDNFKLMGVGSDFGASIIAGIVSLNGCGRVLDEKTSTRDIWSGILHHQVLTIKEKLVPMSPGVNESANPSSAANRNATHIVMEVEWGSQSAVMVRTRTVNSKSRFQAQISALHSAVETRRPIVQGDAAWLKSDDEQVEVIAFSDILNDAIHMSETQKFQEAHEFLSIIPTHIKQENGGKGNPGMCIFGCKLVCI